MKITVKSITGDTCRAHIQGHGTITALVEPSHGEGYILCVPSAGYALGVKIAAKTPAAIMEGVARLWPAVKAFWAERAQPALEESAWY